MTASPQGEADRLKDTVLYMNDKYNKKLTGISQALRRQMTQQERRLWYEFLKELPITFHRQKVIGRYIVDFYCASAKIVIEIDGTQHFLDKGKQSDAERDEFLSSLGLTVLRYSNDDINTSFESVCQDIFNRLITCGAFPPPSPRGEGVATATDEV